MFGGVPLLLLVTEKVPWTTGRANPDENSRLQVTAETTVPSHHQISARWDSPRHRLSFGSAVGGVAERPRLADREGKLRIEWWRAAGRYVFRTADRNC